MALFRWFRSPQISLVHATRGRASQALACRENWLNAAAQPAEVEHVFGVDGDDEETLKAVANLPHRVVKTPGGGCVAAWNAAAEGCKGKVLLQLSDDWLPVPHWDLELLKRIGNLHRPAVLRISDGHRQDDLLCMAILTRARLKQQGWFLPPAYTGVYSDDEFSFRAFDDGVIIEARDLMFTHQHPNYDESVPMDETYRRQNDNARYAEAKKVFLERNPAAKKRWFVKDHWERRFVPATK